jgi:hypothetical protein
MEMFAPSLSFLSDFEDYYSHAQFIGVASSFLTTFILYLEITARNSFDLETQKNLPKKRNQFLQHQLQICFRRSRYKQRKNCV